jgi:hypothetical protein
MKHSRIVAFALICALLGMGLLAFSASAAPVAPLKLQTLSPGNAPEISNNLRVNIVFVGYEGSDVDVEQILAAMPNKYKPHVRRPVKYGIEMPLGYSYHYTYNPIFAGDGFEDAFFDYLASIGEPGPLTVYQEDYNAQLHNSLDVTGDVLYIDAPSTEKWLMQQGQAQLGIGDDYTVFLVNWYSRPDFQFHVYTKTDDPDPDTGYNFGILRPSRKMIAWGGSFGRTWFYDLSAGPESWTENWNVDDADMDGDGNTDYRMPPVWEYGNLSGYRPFDDLSGDLAKVIRFVAINLLFTTSPLYDPLTSEPPEQDGTKVVTIDVFDAEAGVQGRDYVDTKYLKREWADLQPYYGWKVNVKTDPFVPGPKRAQRIAFGVINQGGCWEKYGTPAAMLFCYFQGRLNDYIPPPPPGDSSIAVFAYNAGFKKVGFNIPLGFADDDYTTGKPTYIFAYDNAFYRSVGYGFSTTILHEVGHHIGMSHPHDGYDSQNKKDYGPTGNYFYAWSGDESATIMSYIDVNFSFGQFDKDNMNRFIFERVLTRSNRASAEILAVDSSARVTRTITEADARLTAAREAFNRNDYAAAAAEAVRGYQLVKSAAAQARVTLTEPELEPVPGPIPPRLYDPLHPE